MKPFMNERQLRKNIRTILQKYPNKIKFIKNGQFNRHELTETLRYKVSNELKQSFEFNYTQHQLDNIILDEIKKETQTPNSYSKQQYVAKRVSRRSRKSKIIFTMIAVALLIFIIPKIFSDIGKSEEEKKIEASLSSKEKEQFLNYIDKAKENLKNDQYTAAKKDAKRALKINPASTKANKLVEEAQEEIDYKTLNKGRDLARKDQNQQALSRFEKIKKNSTYYEDAQNEIKDIKDKQKQVALDQRNFNEGSQLLNEGKYKQAINNFNKVSESSNNYKRAQKLLKEATKEDKVWSSIEGDYKKLQKSPEDYIGENVFFYGQVYNIQEMNERTLIYLLTDNINGEYLFDGDGLVILFPKKTNIKEGDEIKIWGTMKGNYANNKRYISKYFDTHNWSIYYKINNRLYQDPVLECFKIMRAE